MPSSPEEAITPSSAFAFHSTRSKSRNVITAATTPLNSINKQQQQQSDTVDDSVQTAEKPKMAHIKAHPHQVTPLDQFPLELTATKADPSVSISSTSAMAGKQVRFTAADKESELLTKAQPNVASKGCVSKRGRYVSPGRRSCNKDVKGSSESSSFPMSPPSLLVGDGSGPSVTHVPSLCSASSHDETSKLLPQATSTTANENDFMAPASPHQQQDFSPDNDTSGKSPSGLFLMPLSSATNGDRDRFGASTPTDFTTDFKHIPSSQFDTSNVLAWLQSPTANGLFSPGFGSMLNTPNNNNNQINNGKQQATTPNHPVVSTSFFFSDVASLPRQPHTPAGAASSENGNNNIICISPLASNKKQHHHHQQQQTPMNLKDIFASPTERKYRSATSTTGKDAPSLDAVVLAERDLMEDEDLSVLLQLASNTTPRGGGNNVFRTSPRKHQKQHPDKEDDNPLPALQLPLIGGNSNGRKSRLAQKPSTQNSEDFAPPQLGMRSSSSSATATKEIFVGGHNKKDNNGKKSSSILSSSSGYPLYPDHPPYYPIPTGMVPTGSMRITVGGQPPPTAKGSSSGNSNSNDPGNNSPPPHPYSDYPSYPPHMYAMYTMGYPPYASHYPPPPPPGHMSMYGAAQQPPPTTLPPKQPSSQLKVNPDVSKSNKTTTATTPTSAKSSKRSAATEELERSKKKKSSHSSSGQPKKKNKSPQLTDRVERQKAADTIQSLNAASGGKNDKAAALAAAVLRGVTMRPSGKWQAQLYFAGKSRYIGVFDTREKAALAYEIAREKLKTGHVQGQDGNSTEILVNVARKAAFDGVNERLS